MMKEEMLQRGSDLIAGRQYSFYHGSKVGCPKV